MDLVLENFSDKTTQRMDRISTTCVNEVENDFFLVLDGLEPKGELIS